MRRSEGSVLVHRRGIRRSAAFRALLVLAITPQAWAGIVPDDRLPPPGIWESAGVEGGIPDRQTVCADVTQAPYNADRSGGTNASTAIQTAINSCPSGQVVFVPAGTYL